jgi:pyruvate/2-oxoglutarate/acetoin dehydrogenase E1 component
VKKCVTMRVHILMGEEVAEYNGAYKASKGMLAEF